MDPALQEGLLQWQGKVVSTVEGTFTHLHIHRGRGERGDRRERGERGERGDREGKRVGEERREGDREGRGRERELDKCHGNQIWVLGYIAM